jgi:hypothetical protein
MKNKLCQNPQIVQVPPTPCTLLPTPLLMGATLIGLTITACQQLLQLVTSVCLFNYKIF